MHGCKLVIQYTIYSWLINQYRFFASYLCMVPLIYKNFVVL